MPPTGPTASQDAFVIRWLGVDLPSPRGKVRRAAQQEKYRQTRDATLNQAEQLGKFLGRQSRLRKHLTKRPLLPLFEEAQAAREAGDFSRADRLFAEIQGELIRAQAEAEATVEECDRAGRQALVFLRESRTAGGDGSSELAVWANLLTEGARFRREGRADEALDVFRRILSSKQSEPVQPEKAAARNADHGREQARRALKARDMGAHLPRDQPTTAAGVRRVLAAAVAGGFVPATRGDSGISVNLERAAAAAAALQSLSPEATPRQVAAARGEVIAANQAVVLACAQFKDNAPEQPQALDDFADRVEEAAVTAVDVQCAALSQVAFAPSLEPGLVGWRQTYATAARAGAIPPHGALRRAVSRSLKKIEIRWLRFAVASTPRQKRKAAEQLRKWRSRFEDAVAEVRQTPGFGTHPTIIQYLDILEAELADRFEHDDELTNFLSGVVEDDSFQPGPFVWDAASWKRLYREAKRLGLVSGDHGFSIALRRFLNCADDREASQALHALGRLERAAQRLRVGLANEKLLAYLDDFDRSAATRRAGLRARR